MSTRAPLYINLRAPFRCCAACAVEMLESYLAKAKEMVLHHSGDTVATQYGNHDEEEMRREMEVGVLPAFGPLAMLRCGTVAAS